MSLPFRVHWVARSWTARYRNDSVRSGAHEPGEQESVDPIRTPPPTTGAPVPRGAFNSAGNVASPALAPAMLRFPPPPVPSRLAKEIASVPWLAQYTLPPVRSTATPRGRLTAAPVVFRFPPPPLPSMLANEIAELVAKYTRPPTGSTATPSVWSSTVVPVVFRFAPPLPSRFANPTVGLPEFPQ